MGIKIKIISGDLTEKIEKRLLEKNLLKKFDVCQMNHHGSYGSSYKSFMTAIKPEVCIVSNGSYEEFHNGEYKGYNHPPEKKIIENTDD